MLIIAAVAVAAYASGFHRWLSLTALAEHRDALAALVAVNRAGALAAFVAGSGPRRVLGSTLHGVGDAPPRRGERVVGHPAGALSERRRDRRDVC